MPQCAQIIEVTEDDRDEGLDVFPIHRAFLAGQEWTPEGLFCLVPHVIGESPGNVSLVC